MIILCHNWPILVILDHDWPFPKVCDLLQKRNDNFLFGLKIEKSWNSLETRLVGKIFCGCKVKSAVTILFKIYRVLLPNIFKDWFLSKKRVWELMREIFPNVIFAPKILLGSKENNSRYLGIFKICQSVIMFRSRLEITILFVSIIRIHNISYKSKTFSI